MPLTMKLATSHMQRLLTSRRKYVSASMNNWRPIAFPLDMEDAGLIAP